MGRALQSCQSVDTSELYCQKNRYIQNAVPFVPLDPIEDIHDDASRHYSDPDAIDDQSIFNDNLPALETPPSAENTVELEKNETDTIDSEHGTIYHEHKRVHEVPPLYNPLPETVHTDRAHRSEAENQSEEIDTLSLDHEPEQRIQSNNDAASTTSSIETSETITRNNITRYSLGEAHCA